MLKFNVKNQQGNDITYLITFQHVQEGKRNPRHATICNLWSLGEDRERNFISSSKAICSKNDQFNKDVGRKRSMSELLKIASEQVDGLNKVVRHNLWNDYFTRTKKDYLAPAINIDEIKDIDMLKSILRRKLKLRK